MREFRQRLQPTRIPVWRWLSGMTFGGVPRAGAGSFTPARRELPEDIAPKPSGSLIAEIRWDVRQLCSEWRQLRVRRALGREFRGVERQILTEQDTGEP